MSTPKVWWHGCLGQPGHCLRDISGRSGRDMIPCPLRPTGSIYEAPYLDGGLAPRRLRDRYYPPLPFPEPADRIVWARLGGDSWQQRYEIERASDECPQGEFLVHTVGECTIAAWWDRTQGDERGACNSCFIVHNDLWTGRVEDMLALFGQMFPRQAKRLADAGVGLKQVGSTATTLR